MEKACTTVGGASFVQLNSMRYRRNVLMVKRQMIVVANFLSGVSAKSDTVCCGGLSVAVLKNSDKMLSKKIWLHYAYTKHTLQLEKLLRQPIYSVMGRIGMLALLRSLLPRIIDCFSFIWMQSTHNLRKVCQLDVKEITFTEGLVLISLCS